MSATHVALAVLVAVIWGVAFVATRVGLDAFSPPQLTALRFLVAAAPVLVLPRPPLPWSALIPVGLTLFAGQFLFQFFGIANGMPPGLASVVVQTQALFTIVFAAATLGERPTRRQWLGSVLALAGLAVIALTVGGDLAPAGLLLTLVSPVSFGVGNVLLKRLGPTDMPSLVAWLSLVPPLPALALSLALDGPGGLPHALARGPWLGLAAALYLGVVATVLAYAIWGALLRRYPAATVTPSRCWCPSSVPPRRRWCSASASGRCAWPAWPWCSRVSPSSWRRAAPGRGAPPAEPAPQFARTLPRARAVRATSPVPSVAGATPRWRSHCTNKPSPSTAAPMTTTPATHSSFNRIMLSIAAHLLRLLRPHALRCVKPGGRCAAGFGSPARGRGILVPGGRI